MTDCPFHDLPPGQTVWVTYENGSSVPGSAEVWCDAFHFAEDVRPVFQAAARAMLDQGLEG